MPWPLNLSQREPTPSNPAKIFATLVISTLANFLPDFLTCADSLYYSID